MFSNTTDIVIPLGSGSRYNNFELRMALRSIACYAMNVRDIYIVSAALPDWVCNVKTLNVPDRHLHNKDANIIDKLLAAAMLPELSGKFLFWSDDQLALHRFDAAQLPISCNPRKYEHFRSNKVWHRRMRNSFEYLHKQHISLQCNFDTHLPMPVKKELFIQAMRQADYSTEPGYCVNTLYCGLTRQQGFIEQKHLKYTAETPEKLNKLPEDKLFLGYNDNAMQSDLPELLKIRFPEKCKYEKSGV